MDYQVFAVSYMWPALLASAAAATLFFSIATGSLAHRLAISAPGILLLLAGIYALVVSPWSNEHSVTGMYLVPFYALFVLVPFSVAYSLYFYRRESFLIHCLQLLVLVPSAAWIWFFGWMTITHTWL